MTTSAGTSPETKLNTQLLSLGQLPLDPSLATTFAAYLDLLLRWNAKTNLTAVREPAEIQRRHFVESILCARQLPAEITSLLDFGSGAGFPGIPIALCRPGIHVTLAESQHKKAAFLREAVRTLNLNSSIHADRAETLNDRFDCVTLRAVDKMPTAVSAAAKLLADRGYLALLTTTAELHSLQPQLPNFSFENPLHLPGSNDRIFILARKTV